MLAPSDEARFKAFKIEPVFKALVVFEGLIIKGLKDSVKL